MVAPEVVTLERVMPDAEPEVRRVDVASELPKVTRRTSPVEALPYDPLEKVRVAPWLTVEPPMTPEVVP